MHRYITLIFIETKKIYIIILLLFYKNDNNFFNELTKMFKITLRTKFSAQKTKVFAN